MRDRLRLLVWGLDNSHPLVDLDNINELYSRVELMVVNESEGTATERFMEKHPTARYEATSASIETFCPDAVLMTLKPSNFVTNLSQLLGLDTPTFINRPAIATKKQFEEAHPLLALDRGRLMTNSVLRFAPKVQKLRGMFAGCREIAIGVAHGVGHWAEPGALWQADLRDGGGVVGSLAYHGLEIASTLMGNDFEVRDVIVESGQDASAIGGDKATIYLRWHNGAVGTIRLDSTVSNERYHAEGVGSDGVASMTLDSALGDDFGYKGAMRAFRDHIEGLRPTDWLSSLALLQLGSEVHQQAYRNVL